MQGAGREQCVGSILRHNAFHRFNSKGRGQKVVHCVGRRNVLVSTEGMLLCKPGDTILGFDFGIQDSATSNDEHLFSS